MDPLQRLQLNKPMFDSALLKARYKALLATVHPDNFHTDLEKKLAHQQAAMLGEAFTLVSDFATQAALFYEQRFAVSPPTVVEPAFLQHMFMVREDYTPLQMRTEYQALMAGIEQALAQGDRSYLDTAIPKVRFYQQLVEEFA